MRKNTPAWKKQADYKLMEGFIQEDGSFDPCIKKYLLAAMILITVAYLILKICLMPRF